MTESVLLAIKQAIDYASVRMGTTLNIQCLFDGMSKNKFGTDVMSYIYKYI
jgi:hypothetical protein